MRRRVRELRIAYDAVMVGAGTVRIDDPLLTVRPPHDRLRPYIRVIVCGREAIPAIESRARRRARLCEDDPPCAAWRLAPQLAALHGKAEVIATR